MGQTVFEYLGNRPFTIVTPATGISYCFDRLAARIAVNPQDKKFLIGIPSLRLVS